MKRSILRMLKTLLKSKSYSYRKAERALGLSRGALSRLFKGTRPLRFSHITGICRLAGISTGGFFDLVYDPLALRATNPDLPVGEFPRESLVPPFRLLEADRSGLFRLSREEREEIQELLRLACSSLATAQWVLWWLEEEAHRRSALLALRTSIGRSGGCLDPFG